MDFRSRQMDCSEKMMEFKSPMYATSVRSFETTLYEQIEAFKAAFDSAPAGSSAGIYFDVNAFEEDFLYGSGYLAQALHGLLDYFNGKGKRITLRFLVHDAFSDYSAAFRRLAFVPAFNDFEDPLYKYPLLETVGGALPDPPQATKRIEGYALAAVATQKLIQDLAKHSYGSNSYFKVEYRQIAELASFCTAIFRIGKEDAMTYTPYYGAAMYATYFRSKVNRYSPAPLFYFENDEVSNSAGHNPAYRAYSPYADLLYQFELRWLQSSGIKSVPYTVQNLTEHLMKYYSVYFGQFGPSEAA